MDQFVASIPEIFPHVELVKYLTLPGPLFFIQYWYLVEIRLSKTPTHALYAQTAGNCIVSFLVRHSDDSSMNDELARWWIN